MVVEETQKVQGAQSEEGVLKTTKPTFYEVIPTIVGANIDSGILELAYSTCLAGWPVLLLWPVVADPFTTFFMLHVVETALHTRKPPQLPGLAEKYAGKSGSLLMFISVCANSIGCMIAYTIGSGNIICTLLGPPNWAGSSLFIVPYALAVWFGPKATGIWERFISTGMVLLLVLVVGVSPVSGKADASRAIYTSWTYMAPILSTAIFCYMAQYTVPELARGMRYASKKLPDAITIGMFITDVLLALILPVVFSLTSADEVIQVATIAWGQALGAWAPFTANISVLCAMTTLYWVIGGAMLTNIVDIFKLKDGWETKTCLIAVACIVFPSFIPAYPGLVSFVDATGWVKTFGGVIMSTVPAKMPQGAHRNGDIEPEWQCDWYAKRPIQYTMITIFLSGAVCHICSMLGILPAGW